MIHISRLPWDDYFMLQAHLTATRSTCDRGPELLFDSGRHGVGAVIVRDNRVIASGYNGSAPGQPHCNDLTCSGCGTVIPYDEKLVDRPHNPEECRRKLPYDTDNCVYLPGDWRGGHLIYDGHCVRTIHSEMNALLQCAIDGTNPQGSYLFTTASPCYDCAKALIRVGVCKVVYGATYNSRYELSNDAKELLKRSCVSVEHLLLVIDDKGNVCRRD